jgi:glycosyltransferase involved in cell wall biosynthesis
VHLIAPAPVGGAESVVRALTVGRRECGGDTEVVALLTDSTAAGFVRDLRAHGVPTTEVREGRRHYLAEVRAVASILESRGADLVHSHVYHANLVGYFAARRCRVPIVATHHGYTGGGARNGLYEWADRRVLRRFDAVVCVSQSSRSWLHRTGCREDRLHVVENGLDARATLSRERARASLGLAPSALAVGWVGRLSAEKGPDLLLRAVRHVGRAGLVTTVIGDGPEHARLPGLVEDLGLGPSVVLAGQRPDAASLLAAFDVLVISSRTEGLPMVLLEAMAARVPVVAFAVGGIPEVLTSGTGWLVEPGDVVALAGAIREAVTDPGEARRRADAGHEAVRLRLSLRRWVERVEDVYGTAAARAARPRSR